MDKEIPLNAVVEVWCGTISGNANIGVRSPTSGLNRQLPIMGPRALGENGYSVHTQLNNGYLQYYSDNAGAIFRILGYWRPDVFQWVDLWQTPTVGTADTWNARTLSVPASSLFEALAYTEAAGKSASVRGVMHDETPEGGSLIPLDDGVVGVAGNAATFIAKANTTSQAYLFSDVTYKITGYWVLPAGGSYITEICFDTNAARTAATSITEAPGWLLQQVNNVGGGSGPQWGGVSLVQSRHTDSVSPAHVGSKNIAHEGKRKILMGPCAPGRSTGAAMMTTYNRILGRSFPDGAIHVWASTPESGAVWFRYTNLDGERGYTVHVQSDASGNIQYYSNASYGTFRILGYYLPDVTFTEDWTSITYSSSSWGKKTLTAPANRVVEIITYGYDSKIGVAWGRGYPGSTTATSSPQGWIVQEGLFIDNPVGNHASTYPTAGTNAATWLTATDASGQVYLVGGAGAFLQSGYFHAEMKLLQPDLNEGLITDSWGAWKRRKLPSYDRISQGFMEYGCNYNDYWGTTGVDNNIVMGPVVLLMWHGVDTRSQYFGARTAGSTVDRRIPLVARQLGGSGAPSSPTRLSELNTAKGNAMCSFLTQPDDDGYFAYFQQSQYYYASLDTWKQPIYGPYIRATGLIYWQWYAASPSPDPVPELYRTPMSISDNAWGGILVIDPNGLREDHPGPVYFLLDSVEIHPGLTNKSGSFSATINDNKNELRQYDMMLFAPDTPYIRDNDEFWVGVQQGSGVGLENNWTPESGGRMWVMGGWITKRTYSYTSDTRITAVIEGGLDYMGLWRQIPIGTLNLSLKIKKFLGGGSAAAFNYSRPTEIYQLFESILDYVNRTQQRELRFTPSDDYFPSETANQGATVDGTTTQYRRQYSGEPSNVDAFTLMEKLCEAGGFEWQIVPDPENQQWGYSAPTAYWTSPPLPANINEDGTGRPLDYGGLVTRDWRFLGTASSRRMLMVYPRKVDGCATVYDAGYATINPPIVGKVMPNWTYRGASTFDYSMTLDYTVIRDIPKILVEDTSNLMTNIIVSGDPPTYPANRSAWMASSLWVDLDDITWKFTSIDIPLPSNPAAYFTYPPGPKYGDRTLVWDDEEYPAICFRKMRRARMMPVIGFHPSLAHQDWAIRMAQFEIDCREMRWLRFKFRDPNYYDNERYVRGNTYTVKLHCDIGNQPYTSWAENYLYRTFTISPAVGSGWTAIDLPLPIVIDSKTAPGYTVSSYNGWSTHGTVDVSKIDFLSFDVVFVGEEPGPLVYLAPDGSTLHFHDAPSISGAVAGSQSIQLDNPSYYFALGEGFANYGGMLLFNEPQPMCYVGDSGFADHEIIYIVAIDTDGGRWDGKNVLLSKPLNKTYDPYGKLFLPGGWSFCVSQLRFEKSELSEYFNAELDGDQANPRRYRVVKYQDMNFGGEINERIRQEVLRAKPLNGIIATIDGDLRYHTGFQVDVDLGVNSPYHNVTMMIDDLQYIVENTDFYMKVVLGPSHFDKRSYAYDLQQLQGTINRKLLRDEVSKTSPKGTEVKRDVL